MRFIELLQRLDTPQHCYDFLKENNLVYTSESRCFICGGRLKYEIGYTRHEIEGRLRCIKSNCRKSYGLMKDSIFENSHLSIKTILSAIYFKALNIPQVEISRQLQITESNLCLFFKKLFYPFDLIPFNIEGIKLGGINEWIEVDETHMITRRDARGRILPGEQYWILGAISRRTSEVRLLVTRSRNSGICTRFLLENVEYFSTVCTDEWRGYSRLRDFGYEHHTVCHKKEFVNSENKNIHTQKIERFWRTLKENVKNSNSLEDLKKKVNRFLYVYNLGLKTAEERFHFYLEKNKI